MQLLKYDCCSAKMKSDTANAAAGKTSAKNDAFKSYADSDNVDDDDDCAV